MLWEVGDLMGSLYIRRGVGNQNSAEQWPGLCRYQNFNYIVIYKQEFTMKTSSYHSMIFYEDNDKTNEINIILIS